MDNLEEMDKLLRLNQEERENMNTPIIIEIESVIKKKFQQTIKSRNKWLHRILPNI